MTDPQGNRDKSRPAWQRLAHRWFVQYNPLYLVSAASVLVGVFLTSEGLAQREGFGAELWLTAITEVYQLMLIGSAALLYRVGQRRPAVMLALLEAVYLCDLTFQTGTAAYLGTVGVVATAVWLALFVVKLFALAWAVRLRLSRGAVIVPLAGAAGLALLPHVLAAQVLDWQGGGALVGLWIFGLFSAGLWTRRTVVSRDRLDAWGALVLRRATTAVWIIWAALSAGHMLWWTADCGLALLPVMLGVTLPLAVRRARGEAGVWGAALAVLVLGAALHPATLAVAGLMSAVVLVLRAVLQPAPSAATAVATPARPHPYRFAPPEEQQTVSCLARLSWRRPAARRFQVGALCALHLSLWTAGWQGGAWPGHLLALDLPLTAVLVLLLWRGRQAFVLLPLSLLYGHLVLQERLVGAPRGMLQWGVLVLGLGFVSLLLGLSVNWLARTRAPAARGEPGA